MQNNTLGSRHVLIAIFLVFAIFAGVINGIKRLTMTPEERAAEQQKAEAESKREAEYAAQKPLRDDLEKRLEYAAMTAGLETPIVIASGDALNIKVPKLTRRDAVINGPSIRSSLFTVMRSMKSDLDKAGIKRICVYESAWGDKVCTSD
jgi:hypothetical protein